MLIFLRLFSVFLYLCSFSVYAQTTPAVINLNTADAQTITNAHIKGIGKKRADAIVAYRSQHGAFKSLDDLKNIKGLNSKIINANRDKLSFK